MISDLTILILVFCIFLSIIVDFAKNKNPSFKKLMFFTGIICLIQQANAIGSTLLLGAAIPTPTKQKIKKFGRVINELTKN
jgi:hypothetical protein